MTEREPVGSLAEEAAKLLAAFHLWAGDSPKPSGEPADGEPGDEAGPVFITRSVPKARARTLRQAREALAKANRIGLARFAPRSVEGVMLAEVDPVPAGPVSTDKLPNPVRLGGISIRYVEAK